MKEVGLNMTKHELDKLFNYLDKNYENSIDYRAYLDLLRLPLNETRYGAVIKAFQYLDTKNAGQIPVSVLAERFNPYASTRVSHFS